MSIKSTIESMYSNRSDVDVMVSDDGIIDIYCHDPDGSDRYSYGNTWYPKSLAGTNCNAYSTLAEAIAGIEMEINYYPQLRDELIDMDSVGQLAA